MDKDKDKNNKEVNHIKIGAQTRVRNVISYALLLLKEKQFNDITLSAIGGAIGSLVNAVEVIKADLNLYQNNKISTVSYQTMDSNENIIQERLYPKMEVVLSRDEPKVKSEGYQGKLNDQERKEIKEFMDKRKESREKNRLEGGNERREDRGDNRGGRGRGRGSRGGFGGNRGGSGGFRGGNRGVGSRGGMNRGYRGSRGNGRGDSRGFGGRGFGRGAPRGRGNNSRRGSFDRDRRERY